MMPFRISSNSSLEELASIALSVHNAVRRMPIAVKSRYSPGVLVEDGEFIISARECQSLDCLFYGDHVRQIHIDSGKYIGTIMFASAIVNPRGTRVAAIGVIDTLGMLSLEGFVAERAWVDNQLGGPGAEDKHLLRSRR